MKVSSTLFSAVFAAAFLAVALGTTVSPLLNKGDSQPATNEVPAHREEQAMNEATTISTTTTTELSSSAHPEAPHNSTSGSSSNSTHLPTAESHTDNKPHSSLATSVSIYFGLILVAAAPILC